MSARKINLKKAAGEKAAEKAEETPAVTTEITESGGHEITDTVGAADPDTDTAATTDDDELADIADIAESDVDEDADALAETAADETAADETAPAPAARRRGIDWPRAFAFGVLPVLALLLAAAAAYLKWEDAKVVESKAAADASMEVAKESTIRLLSYQPDTVEKELTSARDLLTGNFRDSYTQLTNDVVIPGAKEKKIAALANVPAVASISATPTHAVALVFVNQTVTVGNDAPTSTNSSVKVTLDKVGDRWLISEFDPV